MGYLVSEGGDRVILEQGGFLQVETMREIRIPEQSYSAGTYNFSVNNFSPQVNKLVARFTRVSWPGTPSDDVITITATWNTGGGVRATLPGGVVLEKSGTILNESVVELDVPQENDGSGGHVKRNVSQGNFVIQVHQTLTTAVVLEQV